MQRSSLRTLRFIKNVAVINNSLFEIVTHLYGSPLNRMSYSLHRTYIGVRNNHIIQIFVYVFESVIRTPSETVTCGTFENSEHIVKENTDFLCIYFFNLNTFDIWEILYELLFEHPSLRECSSFQTNDKCSLYSGVGLKQKTYKKQKNRATQSTCHASYILSLFALRTPIRSRPQF